jgi:hypothetical protein
LAAIATVAGYFFKRTITDNISKHFGNSLAQAEKRINELIDDHITTARDLTISNMHSRFSFTYYTHYKDDFEGLRKLKFPKASNDTTYYVMREAAIARYLAERGLIFINQLQKKMVNNAEWHRVKAGLVNLKTYNYTVELMCRRGVGETLDDGSVLSVLDLAEECVLIAYEEPVRDTDRWIAMYDTAALAMVNLGDTQNKQRGYKLIKDICAGKTPSKLHFIPSPEIIERLKIEYNV